MKDAVVIAGGAGFIGTNLVSKMIEKQRKVFILDDLSRGAIGHLHELLKSPEVSFIKCNLANQIDCQSEIKNIAVLHGISEVWHLAANSDIQAGTGDPSVDLTSTFLTTFNLLNSLRQFNVGTFVFASSSAVYGNLGDRRLNEDVGPLLPISNYGAMKLASEAIISAACESWLKKAFIFRFPNVVGKPATHGILFDFQRKIKSNPNLLKVLGDGSQKKIYLHVEDLISAMLHVVEKINTPNVQIYNIGPDDDGVNVRWIVDEFLKIYKSNAEVEYGKTNKGWLGDVPVYTYSNMKIKAEGWAPTMTSQQAVTRAICENIDSL